MLKKIWITTVFCFLLVTIAFVRFTSVITTTEERSSADHGFAQEEFELSRDSVSASHSSTTTLITTVTAENTTDDSKESDTAATPLDILKYPEYNVTQKVRLEEILEKVVPESVLDRKFPRCTEEDCAKGGDSCWCYWVKSPRNIPTKKLPQIVFLTFDDYVVAERMEVFRKMKLLHGERRNPNGCPISATFFINDAKTAINNYTMVRQLYDLGHEIATHSLTHGRNYHQASKDFWETEMVTQRENIHRFSGIPLEDLPGLRAPYLNMGGDNQFQMIQENGFGWDSSVITPGYDDGPAWPFKVGNRFEDCWNENCPQFQRYSGFWEVPVGRWIGPDSRDAACDMADMCDDGLPVDEEDAKGFLWKNFLTVYRGSRRPFPLCVHAFTFTEEDTTLGPMYLEVFTEFLDQISQLEDVYLVTVSQLLDWMKDPQPLNKINTFSSWRRSCNL